MPLSKLWNSIRGRSAPSQPAEKHAVSRPQAAKQADEKPAKKAKRKPKGGAGSGFSLFGGGPHAGLCKLVKSCVKTSGASLVLEISVGDGSRAVAVMETLSKTQENVRYIAIDPFELADGGVTLKSFHQTLRAEKIHPKLFPGTIPRGLMRVAHTVGSVDLVLIAAPIDSWQAPDVLSLLSRISHDNTIVLYRAEDETWKRLAADAYRREPSRHKRAA